MGRLPIQTRRVLLEYMAPRYHEAPYAQKRVLLDEFTHSTGYHRTYAQWLLNHSKEGLHRHLALVMLAYSFLMLQRLTLPQPPGEAFPPA